MSSGSGAFITTCVTCPTTSSRPSDISRKEALRQRRYRARGRILHGQGELVRRIIPGSGCPCPRCLPDAGFPRQGIPLTAGARFMGRQDGEAAALALGWRGLPERAMGRAGVPAASDSDSDPRIGLNVADVLRSLTELRYEPESVAVQLAANRCTAMRRPGVRW